LAVADPFIAVMAAMTAEKVAAILHTIVDVMRLSLINLLWTNIMERVAGFRLGYCTAMMKASKIKGGHTSQRKAR
jgi:hypothetical protein